MNEKAKEEFNAVRKTYCEKLPGRIAQIEESWNRVREGASKEELVSLKLQVHFLTGSSGLFGFALLGKRAMELESVLEPFLKQPDSSLGEGDKMKISVFLDLLKEAVNQPDSLKKDEKEGISTTYILFDKQEREGETDS